MPEKVLALLEKGSLTEWQLSERLNISIDEVKACIDYLYNAGFIKSLTINPSGGSCSGNCGKCGGSCNCNSPSSYTIWEII